MVVDLRTPFTVAWYPAAALIPHGGVTNKIYRSEYLVMRRIPAHFLPGSYALPWVSPFWAVPRGE